MVIGYTLCMGHGIDRQRLRTAQKISLESPAVSTQEAYDALLRLGDDYMLVQQAARCAMIGALSMGQIVEFCLKTGSCPPRVLLLDSLKSVV
jgi:hypothetical protein